MIMIPMLSLILLPISIIFNNILISDVLKSRSFYLFTMSVSTPSFSVVSSSISKFLIKVFWYSLKNWSYRPDIPRSCISLGFPSPLLFISLLLLQLHLL